MNQFKVILNANRVSASDAAMNTILINADTCSLEKDYYVFRVKSVDGYENVGFVSCPATVINTKNLI